MLKLLMAMAAIFAITSLSSLSDAMEQARISDIEYCERVDQFKIHGDRGHRNYLDKDCDAIFEKFYKETK